MIVTMAEWEPPLALRLLVRGVAMGTALILIGRNYQYVLNRLKRRTAVSRSLRRTENTTATQNKVLTSEHTHTCFWWARRRLCVRACVLVVW